MTALEKANTSTNIHVPGINLPAESNSLPSYVHVHQDKRELASVVALQIFQAWQEYCRYEDARYAREQFDAMEIPYSVFIYNDVDGTRLKRTNESIVLSSFLQDFMRSYYNGFDVRDEAEIFEHTSLAVTDNYCVGFECAWPEGGIVGMHMFLVAKFRLPNHKVAGFAIPYLTSEETLIEAGYRYFQSTEFFFEVVREIAKWLNFQEFDELAVQLPRPRMTSCGNTSKVY